MRKFKNHIQALDEKRFNNLRVVFLALAWATLVLIVSLSRIMPYALEVGSWVISQIVFELLLILTSVGFFALNLYMLDISNSSKNIKNDSNNKLSSTIKPNAKDKKKSFFYVGLGIITFAVASAFIIIYFGLSKVSPTDADYLALAEKEKDVLVAKKCTLNGFQIKYNSSLNPIIVNSNGKRERVDYLTDQISFKRIAVKGDFKEVAYQCADGSTEFSVFRYKDLLK